MARDCRGSVYVSAGQRLSRCNTVEEAEAAAVLMGLTELAKVYRGHLSMEIDCARLGRDLQISYRCSIRKAISPFPAWEISVVGRARNALAHELAATSGKDGDFLLRL